MLKKIYISLKNLILNQKIRNIKVITKFAFFNALFIFTVSLILNVINIIYISRVGFGWFYYQLKALFYGIFFITTKILNIFHYKFQMNFQNKYSILLNILSFCFSAFLIFFSLYLIAFIILKLIIKKEKLSTYYIYFPTAIFIIFNSYNFFAQAIFKYKNSFIVSFLILIAIVCSHLFLNYHLINNERLSSRYEKV